MRLARSSSRRSIAASAVVGVERSICARGGQQRAAARRFGLRRRAAGEPIDPVGKFAHLLFEPIDRHRTRRCGGEQVTHLFGLNANALEHGGIDDAFGDHIDLGADGANLALQPDDGALWIVGAQRFAQFGDQTGQRVAGAAVAQSRDAFAKIAHRAFKRDDGVARRKIGEAARHRRQFRAQRLDVLGAGGGLFALLAMHFFEPGRDRV